MLSPPNLSVLINQTTVKNKKNKYFTDQLDATEMIADGPAGRKKKKHFKEQLHLEFNSTSSP